MCGICGFSGFQGYDKNKMTELLVDNMSRGTMATGVYSASRGNLISKHNVAANVFTRLFPLPESETLFMGHTRHATQGANIPRNAHPFRCGKIVGIHNGIVYNDAGLATKYGFSKVVVDSEAIFQVLDKTRKDGIDGWVAGLKEINGMIAIAWVDMDKPKSLYLYKRGNPIFTGLLDGGLYFSSIENSLKDIGCHDVGAMASDAIIEFVDGKVVQKTEGPYTYSYGAYGSGAYGRNLDDEYEYEGGATRTAAYYGGDRTKTVPASSVARSDGWTWTPYTHGTGGFWSFDPKKKIADEAAKAAAKDGDTCCPSVSPVTGRPNGTTSMAVVKKDKELTDTTVDATGKLKGGEADDIDPFLTDVIDVLEDMLRYLKTDKNRWADSIQQKIRNLLY